MKTSDLIVIDTTNVHKSEVEELTDYLNLHKGEYKWLSSYNCVYIYEIKTLEDFLEVCLHLEFKCWNWEDDNDKKSYNYALFESAKMQEEHLLGNTGVIINNIY